MNLFKSILKPPESVGVSLATAGLVYGVYQFSVPSTTEVHGASAHNGSVDSSRKKAMWTSTAIVSAAFLVTHDANVFMAGALVLIALDWSIRHANAVHPATGKLVPISSADAVAMGSSSTPADAAYSTTAADNYGG